MYFGKCCRAVVGDARISVPTGFAENSAQCPRDDQGEPILPNDLTWRKFLFMYLASIKILREADTELQSAGEKKKDNAMSQLAQLLQAQRGVKLPPLPFLITNMIKHAGVSIPISTVSFTVPTTSKVCSPTKTSLPS